MPIEYLQIVSVPVKSQDPGQGIYVHGLGWDLLSRKTRDDGWLDERDDPACEQPGIPLLRIWLDVE